MSTNGAQATYHPPTPGFRFEYVRSRVSVVLTDSQGQTISRFSLRPSSPETTPATSPRVDMRA